MLQLGAPPPDQLGERGGRCLAKLVKTILSRDNYVFNSWRFGEISFPVEIVAKVDQFDVAPVLDSVLRSSAFGSVASRVRMVDTRWFAGADDAAKEADGEDYVIK